MNHVLIFLNFRFEMELHGTNIISAEPVAEVSKEKTYIEPIEMERLWFDVTHLFEELLLAFD